MNLSVITRHNQVDGNIVLMIYLIIYYSFWDLDDILEFSRYLTITPFFFPPFVCQIETSINNEIFLPDTSNCLFLSKYMHEFGFNNKGRGSHHHREEVCGSEKKVTLLSSPCFPLYIHCNVNHFDWYAFAQTLASPEGLTWITAATSEVGIK